LQVNRSEAGKEVVLEYTALAEDLADIILVEWLEN
jgi:hypothetical protein